MLTQPTASRLVTLGLTGMAKPFDEQQRQRDIAALAFDERFALLVDREVIERENKRLVNRLRFAKLRQNAVVEDIDIKAARGLDKALFQRLVAGEWIELHQNSRCLKRLSSPWILVGSGSSCIGRAETTPRSKS